MTRRGRDGARPLHTELDVPADLAALRPVRRMIGDAISTWHTPVESDRLLLLVTEVLTNAVDHGTPPISVSMDWDGRRVHVEVSDANAAEPVLGDPEPEDDEGRGVWLLARWASDWGVDHRRGGKAVWFELAAAAPAPAGPVGDLPT